MFSRPCQWLHAGHNDAEFYMPEDFRIGGVVNVYNREFVLTKVRL